MKQMSSRALRSVASVAAGGMVLARSSRPVSKLLDPDLPPHLTGDIDRDLLLTSGTGGRVRAKDLEVPTVTDTTIAFTWATYGKEVRTPYGPARHTVGSNTVVLMGPADGGPMRVVYNDDTPRGVHHAVVRGLDPDRSYRFECWSNGYRATPSLVATRRMGAPEMTGVIRTLRRPAGDFIETIAVTNDTHIGKTNHSRLTSPDADGLDFPEMQLEGLVAAAKEDGASALVVNGDCTDTNTADQVRTFRKLMNEFGEQDKDWFAVRGNHDNFTPGRKNTKKSNKKGIKAGDDVEDNFGDYFTGRQQHWSSRVGGLRLLGVDTADIFEDGGYISPEQMDALRADLLSDPDRPTIMFGHHPVTMCAGTSNMGGSDFILGQDMSLELQDIMAKSPGVMSMYAGHTHRTRRGSADIGSADFGERGASLGYPGGYTLIHVYTGGYMVTYHRIPARDSLDWSGHTRWSMFGMEPEYMLGSLSDRNYTVDMDLSGL
ncbi:metallophosphoesterase family protein [Corynebacterium sputi]|uniref:metallophosphoesterase family protein n=1 Tax=Corynebacterium sputi TaxID=489915 RepID=UPI0009FF6938|nr:metallophosphoesterase family protein [Corynebacterium sputi]